MFKRHRTGLTSIIAIPIVAASAIAACSSPADDRSPGTTAAASGVSAELQRLMDADPWDAGDWGILVADQESGEVLESLNATSRFVTGSTAKTFAVASALEVLGGDHRFRTPIVHTGVVTPEGRLTGDLIMVASGDLTLGGRTTADGSLAVPDFDHYDANAVPGMATITPQDPLAGIDELARQAAASGIRHIDGDVVIDDRLWDPVSIGGVPITPIVVNDNLVDLLVTPHEPGRPATVDWRPKTAAFTVDADVTTTTAGTAPSVTVDSDGTGRILVRGTVPADAAAPFVATYQVPDPPAFARTLLVEALARNGITTTAPASGTNPDGILPTSPDVAALPVAAIHTSPPFREYVTLINKVSHNLGANLLPPLMAVQRGQRTYEDGMVVERDVLTNAGIDPISFTLVDAQGLPDNEAAPVAQTELLRKLAERDDFSVFYDSMPSIGVDGSLANVIAPDDSAVGHIRAKTGTLIGALDGRLALTTKALAGYIDAQSGRRLVFAIYLNDIVVPSESVTDAIDLALDANELLGAMAAAIYRSH